VLNFKHQSEIASGMHFEKSKISLKDNEERFRFVESREDNEAESEMDR
jgi:hypothetical protein